MQQPKPIALVNACSMQWTHFYCNKSVLDDTWVPRLGMTHMALGDWQSAAAALGQGLHLDPSNKATVSLSLSLHVC